MVDAGHSDRRLKSLMPARPFSCAGETPFTERFFYAHIFPFFYVTGPFCHGLFPSGAGGSPARHALFFFQTGDLLHLRESPPSLGVFLVCENLFFFPEDFEE